MLRAWWSTPGRGSSAARCCSPPGVVERVDHDDQKVYVDRSKEQIGEWFEFDPDAGVDDDYRTRLGSYYDETYRTGRVAGRA